MTDDGSMGGDGAESDGLLDRLWKLVRRFWGWFAGVVGVISITVFQIGEINIGVPSKSPAVDCSRGAPGFTDVPIGFSPKPRIAQMIGTTRPNVDSAIIIQEKPVTVGDLRAYLAAAPKPQREALSYSTWQRDPDSAPARDVPWSVASDYARWQSDRDATGCKYRLPSLEEWRQAATRLAAPDGSISRGLSSERSDWLWGLMEWTGDDCRSGGKLAVGAQLSGLNSDRGGGDPYPASRCLGADAVSFGAPGVSFRLVREPARGG